MSIKRLREFSNRFPLRFMGMLSLTIGISGVIFLYVLEFAKGASLGEAVVELLFLGLLMGAAIGGTVIFPVFLMLAEIRGFYLQMKGRDVASKMKTIDLAAILLGILYNILVLVALGGVLFQSDWQETLYNSQKHTPIYAENALTVWIIICVAFIGYVMVTYLSVEKMPPLVLVLGLSAMYLGTAMSILWTVQTMTGESLYEIMLPILPVCCVCITARTVIYKMREWNETAAEREEKDYGRVLNQCNQLLQDANRWPVAAFILMWPLLGVIIAILMLFGQKPDAIIRAWTETSDWNLSQRTAPQNLYQDEHYLCTVAAGGHEKIVKPLRLGIRHGHEVIVNRQLCVANAFEQVLEEKIPRVHKVIRGAYDKYGFPVARLIKTKVAADIVYFMMKPVEWIFLIVLYLVDVKPENRIAVQYMGNIDSV